MKLEFKTNNEHGLTVLELMTVVAIIAIMSVTAVPNFTIWRNNYQIRSETERVHMDLLSARMTAMKAGNNVVVDFNSVANSYSILNDTNNNGSADTGESFGNRTLDYNLQFGFAGGSITDPDGNLQGDPIELGATETVTFNPRGQSDLSGVIFLIHKNHFQQNDNSRLRAISIIQATGAAELWKYNGGAWE